MNKIYSEQEKQSWTQIGNALNSESADNTCMVKDYSWITEEGKIDGVAFCRAYAREHPLKCVNGIFYGRDGVVDDENMKAEIYQQICEFYTTGVAKKVDNLISALKLE